MPESEQDFLYSLPNDPEDALALFEAWVKKDSMVTDSYGNESLDENSYISKIIAFCNIKGIFLGLDDDEIEYNNGRTKGKITRLVMESKLKLVEKQKSNLTPSYVLTPAIRTKIHHHLGIIRKDLNKLDLTDLKRNALFNKLNNFAASVDKDKTSLEMLGSLCVSVAKVAPDCTDKIIDIIGMMKNAEEYTPLLIAKEKKKLLEAPQKKIEDQSQPNDNTDDEIPF